MGFRLWRWGGCVGWYCGGFLGREREGGREGRRERERFILMEVVKVVSDTYLDQLLQGAHWVQLLCHWCLRKETWLQVMALCLTRRLQTKLLHQRRHRTLPHCRSQCSSALHCHSPNCYLKIMVFIQHFSRQYFLHIFHSFSFRWRIHKLPSFMLLSVEFKF